MRRLIAFSLSSLCIVSAAGAAGEAASVEEGTAVHFSVELSRVVTETKLSTMNQAGVPVPYSRLAKDNIAYWTYTHPICEPVTVEKVHKDGSLTVRDAFFTFKIEGPWGPFAFDDRNQCRIQAADVLRRKLHGDLPKWSFSVAGDRLTFQ